MKEKMFNKDINKYIPALFSLLWVFTILAVIKGIFADTGNDNSYAVIMSFGHLHGDRMFQEMWEVHQTSMYLTDLLMLVYGIFVPSFEGVMLYLQVCGTVFSFLVAFFIYKIMKERIGNYPAQLMAIFYIIFRPKFTPFPEFSNMQYAFSVIIWLLLIKYFDNQKKKCMVVVTALVLCLQVLSYPGTLVTYVILSGIIFIYGKDKLKDFLILTGTCGLVGASYIAYFAIKIGLSRFVDNIRNILNADSHALGKYVTKSFALTSLGFPLLWVVCSLALAIIVSFIMWKKTAHKWFWPVFGGSLIAFDILFAFFVKGPNAKFFLRAIYLVPAIMIIAALVRIHDLSENDKFSFILGFALSAGSFLAALISSDLGAIWNLAFLCFGGVVSFLVYGRNKKMMVWGFLICAVVVAHRGLYIHSFAESVGRVKVWEIESRYQSGPNKGIVCDLGNVYRTKHNEAEHKLFITPDDTVLLVSGIWIDCDEYILMDADIANPNTVGAQNFNDTTVKYFELYPDKRPTVIAVAYNADSNCDYILEWLKKDYIEVGKGENWPQWTYYRLKNEVLVR